MSEIPCTAPLSTSSALAKAFAKADDVLRGAVQGISDIIMKPGYVNVDFADVKTVMSEKGIAMMGTGVAVGKERGVEAASQAIGSELLEDINLKDARGILVNLSAKSPTMGDMHEVNTVVEDIVAEDAQVIYGAVIDENLNEDELIFIKIFINYCSINYLGIFGNYVLNHCINFMHVAHGRTFST